MKQLQRHQKESFLNQLTLGTWLTIPHPAIAEILGRVGFDWLTIDLEHSAMSLETAAELIRTTDLQGIRSFVRVGSHDANVIKRVMDSGAHGIIASTINTVEEAQSIVNAVKYPPIGTRGVGLSRAQGYADEFDDHYDWLNNESIVLVQIEHIKGVENMEQIMSVEGVDGFFVGPYDLSASLGIPGEFHHPKMIAALDRVSEVHKKSGTLAGIHVVEPVPVDLQQRVKEGYRFIAYGLDFLLMSRKAQEGLNALRDD